MSPTASATRSRVWNGWVNLKVKIPGKVDIVPALFLLHWNLSLSLVLSLTNREPFPTLATHINHAITQDQSLK